MDAHCECTDGWLEPLLQQIFIDRHTVVSPIIDHISNTTFEYKPNDVIQLGGFDELFNFKWWVNNYDVLQSKYKIKII